MRKFIVALVATATLLVAAQAEAGGFRSRSTVRVNGNRTTVRTFSTGGFAVPTYVPVANPFFAQPTFVPVQPNVFVPLGFNGGFYQVNAFGGGCCH